MALYANVEYGDRHLVKGFCIGNARAASREYQRRCPEPNRRVVSATSEVDHYSQSSTEVKNSGAILGTTSSCLMLQSEVNSCIHITSIC
jgi:hypothetical protein